jgi:hypothetical protein
MLVLHVGASAPPGQHRPKQCQRLYNDVYNIICVAGQQQGVDTSVFASGHITCSLNTGGAVHTAQAATCSFKAKMQRQIRMDWLRVDSDIRLEAGVPAMQLNGRDPTLTKRAFDAKWGRLVRYVQGAPLADISTASLAQPTAA